jgi:hypothetical protein
MLSRLVMLKKNPGHSIRPVDPIGNDRIRVGFHRNPTFSLKNRSDPTGLLSDSFQSDSDPDFIGIGRNPMNFRSDPIRISSDSVQFRPNPDRNPTERNPTTTLSDPTDIICVRSDPIRPNRPGNKRAVTSYNFAEN